MTIECISCGTEIEPQCDTCRSNGFPICIGCVIAVQEEAAQELHEADVDDGSNEEEW